MLRRMINAARGAWVMSRSIRIFFPDEVFRDKSIAIVGAANSAFEKPLGSYIDSFDLVVRVNKAVTTWKADDESFIGKRTDILYHSFYENNESGGGPLDFELFESRNIRYVINPINDLGGWRLNFNFYKKYLSFDRTYILSTESYKKLKAPFGRLRPTIGYSALHNVLNAPFRKLYITGFTFFRTPYAGGYRDNLVDMAANKRHIASQAIHDPEIEFAEFLKMLELVKGRDVRMDDALLSIVKNEKPGFIAV